MPTRRELLITPFISSIARTLGNWASYPFGNIAQEYGVLGALAAGYTVFPKETGGRSQEYTTLEMRRFGEELEGWTLSNGASMRKLFPEVQWAADILAGRVDPRNIYPSARVPLQVDARADTNAWLFRPVPDKQDSRQIAIRLPNRDIHVYAWTSYTEMTLQLSEEVATSSARFPVMVKETSQFYDFVQYVRVYKKILEREVGIQFSMTNPKKIPTSEAEFLINVGDSLGDLELQMFKHSQLHDLHLDMGTAIRTGGILFANWLNDQKRLSIPIPDNHWVRAGKVYAEYLIEKDFIHERSGVFVWKQNTAPRIDEKLLAITPEVAARLQRVLRESTQQ